MKLERNGLTSDILTLTFWDLVKLVFLRKLEQPFTALEVKFKWRQSARSSTHTAKH